MKTLSSIIPQTRAIYTATPVAYMARCAYRLLQNNKQKISAVSPEDAEATARTLVSSGQIGLHGTKCISIDVSQK
jgi:hypothetical protein